MLIASSGLPHKRRVCQCKDGFNDSLGACGFATCDIVIRSQPKNRAVATSCIKFPLAHNAMKTFIRFLFFLPMSLALADSAKLDFNGHSYQRFDTVMDWMAAKTFCEAKGAHLATITTSAEHDFVTANFLSRYVWLGGSDAAAEGTWTWITGETWSYSNWGSGEPNNGYGRGEHYLSTTPLDGGIKWNDLDNSPGVVVPLCEWDSQVVVAPSACGAAISGVTFSDSFPGTSLDASKWATTGQGTGGSIAVTPGKAQFNVAGDILLAQTVNNPIPTTGDFSIYCKGKIYAANSSHAALCQAQVASWPVAASPYDPGTYWGKCSPPLFSPERTQKDSTGRKLSA